MSQLWAQIKDNLSFLGVSGLITIVVALASWGAEFLLPEKRKVSKAKKISIIAVCSAIAAVLHMLDFPLLFLAPEFYKVDFSELPVLMCGFFLGPSSAVICEAIKVILKLLLKGTSTLFVGDFANFIIGCTFILPATIIYHVKKSKKTAIIGLVAGSFVMTVFGSLFNAVYLLPKFSMIYGIPLDAIIAMGTDVNSHITSVSTLVLWAVAPLNLIKSVVISILTFLLYKKVEKPIFGLKA